MFDQGRTDEVVHVSPRPASFISLEGDVVVAVVLEAEIYPTLGEIHSVPR